MKIGLRVISILAMVGGAVWILQGINVLPGSFMTGHIEWAYYGAIALLAGLGLFLFTRRK